MNQSKIRSARTSNSKEPQQKYRLRTVSIKIGGGGLKPVLRDPNLAPSFCHGSKHIHVVLGSSWRFSNSSMDHHGKQVNHTFKLGTYCTMMKQRWWLDRNNVLRPTPGDPWGVEQHHLNTGAKENKQLNTGGPSNKQKCSGPSQLK